MATARLCVLYYIIVNIYNAQAMQVCLANNGQSSQPTATLTLQPAPCQHGPSNAGHSHGYPNSESPQTSRNLVSVPIQFHQLNLQPLDTSPASVQTQPGKCTQNNPTISLTITTPASTPIAATVSKCPCNNYNKYPSQQQVQYPSLHEVQYQSQNVIPAAPCSGVESNQALATPVTLNLSPRVQSTVAVASQPYRPCAQQSSLPVQISIDHSQKPQCTCGQNDGLQIQPSYVLSKNVLPRSYSSYVPIKQESPQPYYVASQAFSPVVQQYEPTPTYQSKVMSQGAKTSSKLKMLLPLLFNLIKEKKLNCGCQNNCKCGYYNNFEPQVYGGYSRNANYGVETQTVEPQEFDPYIFPGKFNNRKTIHNNNSSDEDNSQTEFENTTQNDTEE